MTFKSRLAFVGAGLLALFLAVGSANAQCTGGSIAGCPPAVNPQPTDYLLGYQNAQNPHNRKFTLSQTAAGALTLNVGSTPIINGTDTYLLFYNAGVLGNEAVSSLNIALNQLPVLTANTVLGAITATRPAELAMPSCSAASSALTWTSGTGFGCNSLGGVGTTGSPSNGNLTKFSGPNTITNGDLSGDATTSGTLVVTVGNLSGVTNASLANSGLTHSSMTIGGQSISLGGSTTNQGTGGKLQLSTGTTTTGHAAVYDASGNVIDGGAAPGTGTVTNVPNPTVFGVTCSVATATTTPTITCTAGAPVLGTPASVTLTNGTGLPLSGLLTQAANTVVANVTTGSASPTAASLPSCVDSGGNHLNYTNGTGFSCGTSGAAASLTVGGTSIASGTTTRVLFDNAGTLGEYSISGTGSVVMTTSPSISGLTVTGSFTATGLVTNADLVNTTISVNGTTCTLGSSCTPQAGGIIPGTTPIGGTSGRILYDNGSFVSESAGLNYDGTSVVTLGVAGASVGGLALKNATSGTVNIVPVTGALGTVTLSAPARTATLGTTTGTLTNGNCAKFDSSGNIIDSGAGCGTGSGSVTSVSVVSANGFAGTVATATTTPAITISTSITGALKGNGTAVSQAACSDLSNGATGCSTATGTSGATIPLLNGANTWSGVQSVNSGDLALKGATSGTTTLNAAATAGTTTITLPGGTTDFSATGGSNQVVKQTSSGGAFTVATLGSGDVPCAAMPALTGGVTSSAGSCATTAASVPTTALTGTTTDAKTITFDSTTAVTAQTISFPIEWTSYTITQVKSAVNGGGSFTANVKIGSTSATGCSAISVSGATNTNTSCTAANTGSANDIINVVLTSPSGTVNQAYVSVVFTHTVN